MKTRYMHVMNLYKNLKGTGHLEDVRIDQNKILNNIKETRWLWIGFIWARVRSTGGIL
jgi:hypothetical protein